MVANLLLNEVSFDYPLRIESIFLRADYTIYPGSFIAICSIKVLNSNIIPIPIRQCEYANLYYCFLLPKNILLIFNKLNFNQFVINYRFPILNAQNINTRNGIRNSHFYILTLC